MPSKLLLRHYEADHSYHLLHKAKKDTVLFNTPADYKTFILLLSYYLRFPSAAPLSWVSRLDPKTVIAKQKESSLSPSPVTLRGFLLLPNHFHLVLQENSGAFQPGISNLMRRVSVAYAMYYNKTYGVKGTIYQGKYKNIEVPEDSLAALLDYLHHHPDANDTFLALPAHSSRTDYLSGSPRPWVKPVAMSNLSAPVSKFTLEK